MSRIYRRSSDGAAAGDSVPFRHGGSYHLFHLSCPRDSLGRQYPYRCTTSQRHAVSKDLVNWEELPIALAPGPDDYDLDGAWTGSIVERNGTFYLFYTGHRAGAKNPQTICVSTSRDNVHFTKSPKNPILKPDPKVFEDIDFRDPYIFWNDEEQKYWMLIAARHAAGPERRRGTIALSISDDLETWSAPEPFYSPWNTMCPECPELFKLGDWWYLVYSHFSENMKTTYRVAKSSRGPWKVPRVPGLDGRRLYAAKSLPDGDRRILWGSIYERVGLSNDSDWTYGGDFGVPRELRSLSEGTLAVSLPREVAASFGKKVPFEFAGKMGKWKASANSLSGTADQSVAYGFLKAKDDGAILLTCTITAGEGYSPFGILIHPSEDLNPSFGLVFEPTRQSVSIMQYPQSLDPFWASLTKAKVPVYEIDGPRMVERPLPIKPGEKIKVQILVEGSMIDAFVNDRLALAYRAYDTGKSVSTFGVFLEDGTVVFNDLAITADG
jgi:beta-fructofuranosidase